MGQLYPFVDPTGTAPPRVIARGKGIHVWDEEGTRLTDAASGLWCTALGWGNEALIEAATEQMRRLSYYHSFLGRTHEAVERLTAALVPMLPEPLSHMFYGLSGSDAVDTAVKLARYAQNARGRHVAKRIVARHGAYHGVGGHGAGLTGMDYAHEGFDLPGDDVIRVGRPHLLRDGRPGEDEAAFCARLVRELDEAIAGAGGTVAAFIGEPIMGSGGVIIPPKGYWGGVQEVLRAHDVLLIVDEVICGFGRTGGMWGCETFGIRPDLMCMAKQLTSAYAPLSATAIAGPLHDEIVGFAGRLGTFGHGFTYGGHPVSCAVALKAIEIYREMDAPRVARELGEVMGKALAPLSDHPMVAQVRRRGLIAAVEMEGPPGTAMAAAAEAEARGTLFRVAGENVCLCPPYISTPEDLLDMARTLHDALEALC